MSDMDTGAPTLEVGFAIDTGGSFDNLTQLNGLIDRGTANALAEFAKIEKASAGMLSLGGATASFQTFGSAITKGAQSAARELATVEKAGEKLATSLTRQNAEFGKTREQLRGMKVETAALAAEQKGLAELAARLRSQEAELYAQEFTAARRARLETEALADEKTLAAQQAVAAAEKEAQALREAALAHGLFEAAARRGMEALRDMQAVQKAAAADVEAKRIREAAFAYGMFEAAARKGAAALRGVEAAQAAAAREDEAQRMRSAALGHAQFEAAARRGAQAMRDEEAAAERDASALARLRAMLDPAADAQSRLNVEIAEARRVMTAAGASAEDLARAESMLADRAALNTQTHNAMAGAARKNGFALQTIALQLPDITQGLLTGQKPMTVFIQQGFQIVQVAQMAEGGLRGFGREVAGLALRFAPFLIGLAAAGAGFALFNRWINQGVTNDQLTRDLGKITGGANATKAELYKLKDETVTWADTSSALFSVVGKDVASVFVGDMKKMGKDVKDVLDDLTSYARSALAGIYAGMAGTKAYLGEIEKGGLLGLGKMALGQGDPELLEKTYGAAYDVADKYLGKLGARLRKAAIENARERISKKVGFNNTPEPKVDKHAEKLARDAAAVEAQISNLYKLADAYGVSGAAALIAEAREKAESKAIKQRADIEAAVAQQVRLSIAQRVADAAKGTATMRDQAAAQEDANAAIVAGILPAEQAADLIRDRIAELPLLAAIEAAQKVADLNGMQKATDALEGQRAARDRLTNAEHKASLLAAISTGSDRVDQLKEELRLVGATDAARVHALATLQATQEAKARGWDGVDGLRYINQQVEIADRQQAITEAQTEYNAALSFTADLFDEIDQVAQSAANGIADAFGDAGRAIGDAVTIMSGYYADQARLQQQHEEQIKRAGTNQRAVDRENQLFAIRSSSAQIGLYGDMTSAAKGFFKEGSGGYKAMAAAEKVFRAIELAMAVKNAAVQLGLLGGVTAARVGAAATGTAVDTAATAASVANSTVRATADATAAMAKTAASSPFPFNLAGMAVMAAALASLGLATGFFGGGGSKNTLAKANDGTGTVLGDTSAKSDSIKNAIDALADVDTLTNTYARDMAASLKSIDSQIGGVATLLVRAGNIDASGGVDEGFKTNAVGSILKAIVPVFGGALSSLFGTKTTVVGNGLFGGPQSVSSILDGGFDASYYSDVQKKKKLFGLTTSTKYSTQYTGADAGLENQFTLILREFNTAIASAAGPLGESTTEIQNRLNSFVVDLGKIDLKDLTGAEIREKLSAVFGAAADGMASAAFPAVAQFQKVGEGTFETLVRVASTVEAVGASLDLLGTRAQGMSVAVKLGLADQFDSVADLTSAADAYFQAFYSAEEQAAAKTAQFGQVFASLGVAMPATIADFRALVEAQDLTSSAGQATYATLLQLAPAFADLKESMEGAKSAADILSEREDLNRQLLELQGNTVAIRALDLAQLDVSNRALQEQIYALQDAQTAAKAAADLASAWSSVGDSITTEIERIRGLSGAETGGNFASLLGQFNAATSAARSGGADAMDAAKSLPGLSQALLSAAALVATSRQELDRIQAQTAASLEATNSAIGSLSAVVAAPSASALITAGATSQAATTPVAANDDMASEIRALREELVGLRSDTNAGNAAIAGSTGRIAKKLDDVTAASGGDAISVASAA